MASDQCRVSSLVLTVFEHTNNNQYAGYHIKIFNNVKKKNKAVKQRSIKYIKRSIKVNNNFLRLQNIRITHNRV